MMKTYGYISTMILFSILLWNTSLLAQDDLYFDPSTDEYFAPKEDKYADDNSDEDEYVDEAFDDGDYYDDDFYYSRRIRRFNRPQNSTFGYYNPWFTNNSYIDPFYYSSRPGMYVSFGNGFNSPYGYNPYGYNAYSNPYYNPYLDPCYNPYYSSYYGNYGYYGGNPYYAGNAINNPSNDYTYTPPNFGPRRGTGGTVDTNGNGRVSGVKEGRGGNDAAEAAPLNYFENGISGGRTPSESGRGTISKDVIGVGSEEPSKSTRPTSTRGKDLDTETTEPSKSTRPTRTPRSEPRSTTPPRSTPRSSTPRSSRPKSSSSSTPRSSSPRSSSSKSSGSSSSKSSGRSGKNPR